MEMGGKRGMVVLAPGLFVLLWSTGFIGAKFGLPYAEPATFLALRFSMVALLLLPIVWVTRSPWPRSWAQAGHIIVSGILVHGVYLGGVFASIKLGLPAGVCALIVGMQPIVTAVLIGPFLNHRLQAGQWLGFLIGTVGVILVITPERVPLDGGVLGLAFTFLAVLGISVGTLYQKRFCEEMDLCSGSFLQFTASALLMLVLSLLFEEQYVIWSSQFVAVLVWLVIALSLGAVTLLWLLIRYGVAERVASLFFLVPPVTAVMAWLMLQETMQVRAIFGMMLAAFGVLAVNRTKQLSKDVRQGL